MLRHPATACLPTWASRTRGTTCENRVGAAPGTPGTPIILYGVPGTRDAARWTEAAFQSWCAGLSNPEAASFRKYPSDANSGMTWLEGNMSWTRYNHLLPPGLKSCANGLTWNGVAMTSSSRHPGVVRLLLGDGSVRPVKDSIDPAV
jgi:Protein of unknown function (DUF1559)